ncbi:MAG: 30S ribosomal protein S20 [Candidatus Beckwithbacteria bacterium GW2011_GWB1_47_15]|uniref:Small ribosomal subunit protein bS20 n=1 Tax=Candidatus Beckwithbacteria bacterium GW2011_GWB1_47_15 TaxID=1618371 RepID=A0A0G1RXK8_9BACT|nr:MAG: 30S ribosomal protein S20, small subunit ribosomal protein S20 [Candidatus Beckwithbacteria bacterium GW2011_GWC1_49_16]AQS30701.1 hypothetical protein [uncultured bacterium]KKU35888.1 MAG: 30S ribosomal protein S20 [Candidatus Beckwithbacteria bacterium GW2011_GWA1_46_30]KKU61852.1 MAG: 30S ribosomal protein S20 [Candidatus Beckwithbacteria bacterium GW2011_GWB1_47_15]KKU72594.1 MAG: 30S ribosomal protein S20 [Candidatus Beckwithbacteria bacterium GW2011_GWA2_47_25]KKW04239.1 MAG: 30S
MGVVRQTTKRYNAGIMPIIKSAEKKLRSDKSKTRVNQAYRLKYREAVKVAREKKTKKAITEAFRTLDRAAKRKVIHKNKADRLKSRLMKRA